MTFEDLRELLARVENLQSDAQAKFGRMNAHQMMCHVSDQIRVALGQKTDVLTGGMNPKEVIKRSLAGEFVPTPKGMGQVENEGTAPSEFKLDKAHLEQLLQTLYDTDSILFPHPYFGDLPKEKWLRITLFHMDHHLKQFGC